MNQKPKRIIENNFMEQMIDLKQNETDISGFTERTCDSPSQCLNIKIDK